MFTGEHFFHLMEKLIIWSTLKFAKNITQSCEFNASSNSWPIIVDDVKSREYKINLNIAALPAVLHT